MCIRDSIKGWEIFAWSTKLQNPCLQILGLGTPCEYFPTFDEIENFLLNNCEAGDLLITMGAGDVVKIGEQLLGK